MLAATAAVVILALSSMATAAAQQPPSFNTTFQPWEVMGPVRALHCARSAIPAVVCMQASGF